MGNSKNINQIVEKLSSDFNKDSKEFAIILAAGHGKRIKSHRSKMLHQIWGIPTVERVYNACKNGIAGVNSIIVVGIKAIDVMNVFGKREHTQFVYQEHQNGTGHAVQVALEKITGVKDGIVYVFPGDMGLINKDTVAKFRSDFLQSKCDMMVLTGIYNGNPEENSYGRIVRVKKRDANGNIAGDDEGKVIQIIEHKDILALSNDKPLLLTYNRKEYSYTKQELINNNEFNSGVYAFDYNKLIELIEKLSSDNVQNEIYITDLIELFNKNNYTVSAVSPEEQYVVMGFNNKSVLKKMESIARRKVYEKLKDIIEIDDPDDFFIHENVVDDIIELDKQNKLLDIAIGQGVYIGKGVKLNYNIKIYKNCYLNGNILLGENVTIAPNVHLSCFPNQQLKIGNNVQILWGDIIKGNIVIGDGSVIESSVNMTGSDEYPLKIGKNVLIKGTSYLFGSIIEDDVFIEHSVLVKKRVSAEKDKNGNVKPVRYFIPACEGKELISDI